MNISLVITGLATCGGLFFAGVDLGWGDDSDCSDAQSGLAVDVDFERSRSATRAGASGAQRDSPTYDCGQGP